MEDLGHLPAEAIPRGSSLWCTLAGIEREWDGPGTSRVVVIGLYDVDTAASYLRPQCSCGWSTEAVTTWEAEARDHVAQYAMLVHMERDHGVAEPRWAWAPQHWSFYDGAGAASDIGVVVNDILVPGPAGVRR